MKINSIDMTILAALKIELQNIEALNQNISPAVTEYLTRRIAEIESPPAKD